MARKRKDPVEQLFEVKGIAKVLVQKAQDDATRRIQELLPKVASEGDLKKTGIFPEPVEGVTVVVNEDARRLVTIGPDHPWWKDPLPTMLVNRDAKGLLVRVQPPADATPGQIDRLVEQL